MRLPEENNNKYSKFKIRHVQNCCSNFCVTKLFSADAKKTEVIDLGGKGTLCDEHADFPEATSGAVGALMKEKWPLICGGTNTESDCYFFKNQTWHKTTEKTSVKRIYSASVIDPTGNLWITGGLGEEASATSEYIDLNADSGSVTSNFGPKLDMGGKYLLILVFTPFSYKNSNSFFGLPYFLI